MLLVLLVLLVQGEFHEIRDDQEHRIDAEDLNDRKKVWDLMRQNRWVVAASSLYEHSLARGGAAAA